ncbi:MAG: hypothetical protein IJR45_05715 [Firmicutes bacterium]|nr:hypothetical protein [Bacillota bacterium]MBQ9604894.1 hypothetical protein [Bacillota bacterium]
MTEIGYCKAYAKDGRDNDESVFKQVKLRYLLPVLLTVCLIPYPGLVKDGGTWIYDAILYNVWDYHAFYTDPADRDNIKKAMASGNEEKITEAYNAMNPNQKYYKGIVVTVLDITVFDNTYVE